MGAVRLGFYAFKHNAIHALPVKLNKLKIRERWFTYLLITDDDGNVLIHKRGEGDIWANLYELPLIETPGPPDMAQSLTSAAATLFIDANYTIKKAYPLVRHQLTHQRLYVSFIHLSPAKALLPAGYFFTEVKNLKNLALPQIIFIFLTNFLN